MSTLSILIPARNEMFLARTVEDILSNIEGDTDIFVGLDGLWADPPIVDHPKVTVVHVSESIGQRAMTNQLCRLSKAKYVMKVDAHCAFDKGFDVKMMEAFEKAGDNVTMVPVMRNLHAFDWVCPDGHRRYQGPSGPCKECGKETTRDIKWIGKNNPQSTAYCFDPEPHFQYHGEFKKRPEGKPTEENHFLTETMSLQGSCFMLTRDKYWELNICDEEFGSWGSQGIEVAVKTWLSGGRVLCNHKSWYAHLFRTAGGDFGFPYKLSGNQVQSAKKFAKELFFENKWPKQVRSLSWLIERFSPVPGWGEEELRRIKCFDLPTDFSTFEASSSCNGMRCTELMASKAQGFSSIVGSRSGSPQDVVSLKGQREMRRIATAGEELSKGILYYTDNKLNMRLARAVRKQISKSGIPVTSVSRKPVNFGTNIVLKGERGPLQMYRQILAGLEAMKEDVVYFCEHDVFYHPSHFAFVPKEKEVFYYNGNYWFVRQSDGFAIHYNVSPLSGLVVYREAALKHFRERVALIEKEGFSYHIGFEPFTHNRIPWEYKCTHEIFMPEGPNVDIAHEGNVTWKRWKQDDFRKKPTFWGEAIKDDLWIRDLI